MDKFRQLARRQEREARGKGKPRGAKPARSSQRTRKKEQLFAEVLARYQKRLADLKVEVKQEATKLRLAAQRKLATAKRKAPARKTAAKSAKRKPAKTKTNAGAKRAPTRRKAVRVSAAAKRSRVATGGLKRRSTHIAALGRRSQARRDSRRS
jgi:hypothetical protein